MSYCPECGEKVAQEDVFCPFCGISLKPLTAVDDASMSDTIVDLQSPVAFNQETAAGPSNQTQNPPVSEGFGSAETPTKPATASGFVAGDTSENWAMKTESVEIPAERLEDLRNAPPPSPFNDQETPGESAEKSENVWNAPTPSIIQEQKPESKPFNPFEETPINQPSSLSAAPADPPEWTQEPKPFDNPFDFSAPGVQDSGPIPHPPVEEKLEDDDFDRNETPSEIARSNIAKNSERFSDQSREFFENNTLVPSNLKLDVPAKNAPNEPPIVMPDAPFEFENQDAASRFDSVQIIQKKEIEEEKAKSLASDASAAQKDFPAAEPRREDKDAHSSTTPNIGNSDTDGRKSAKLKPLDEGTILNGRYEIVRKIGGGGMGAVYLANDRNLGGVLRAVKEMVQSYIESEQQEKAIADFKRESLLLTSLDHQSIPTIYDYFLDEKEGRFYLVMKYISGGDLAGRLRAAPEGRLDEKTVTEWAIQIADVLDYLHNHEPSIVYRDLKPANVMIDGNSGRVMLIDFGIARWVNKEEKGVTAVGTMGYAPPELFSGNVEPRSDIYSLGSTMFHLLTGADPQSNPLLIFDFQKNPRPRQISSQLSDQIEQILMRAVEYNAEARFASAAEMRDALQDHLQNLKTGKVTYGVKVAPSNRAFSEQAVFCGFCGKQIVATDVFCAFCGAQQPIAQQGAGAAHPSVAVQPMTAKLIIQATGELEPSTFRLEKHDNLLGRRDPMSNIFPEVDLSKFDPQTKISRRHARIWREGNSFLVEDLGSSNGTTLLPSASDSVRLLPHQPHTLTNGDKIRLGDTTLHFTIG
ncbi:MAG TPA: protein kinase [Pyrinomonadaceae bacterium]|jgi:serine/threonine-protein kinase